VFSVRICAPAKGAFCVHIVHTCEFANIVLFFAHFVTNLRQFVHHVSVQWQWILCTPNATKELSQGPFLELAQHNK